MKNDTTERQREIARQVVAAWFAGQRHYRAQSSGERVTLASLYRHGVLGRRAWRGQEGAADAAYEYRPSDDLLRSIAAEDPKGSERE